VSRAGGIEARRRLVEQQDTRLVNQRPRDRHALLEALGKLAGDFARAIEQLDQPERFIDARRGIHHALQSRIRQQVDADG
jgi:hypothetical protein